MIMEISIFVLWMAVAILSIFDQLYSEASQRHVEMGFEPKVQFRGERGLAEELLHIEGLMSYKYFT